MGRKKISKKISKKTSTKKTINAKISKKISTQISSKIAKKTQNTDKSEESSDSESIIDYSSNSESFASFSDSDDRHEKKSVIIQKRRGRPPKKAIIPPRITQIAKKNIIEKEEDIILKLYNDSDSDDSNYSENSELSKPNKMRKKVTTQKKNQKFNMSYFSETEDNKKSERDLDNMTKQELIKKCKSLLNELEESKKKGMSNLLGIKEKRTIIASTKLIDINSNKQTLIKKTNLACWWCTEHFDTPPCFIPDRLVGDTYYIFGNFCCFNCALAYNNDMHDSRIRNRTLLLQKLCREVYGLEIDDTIIPSSRREILDKYVINGMTIQQYRDKARKLTTKYIIRLPPMIPLNLSIEEYTQDPD